MAPIRLTYHATPVRLAASLGSTVAREMLDDEPHGLDDAFALLLSCSDIVWGDPHFDFGPPRFWPYTLESALRMAVGAYRAYLPDWDAAFAKDRANIPRSVPHDFVRQVLRTVARWTRDPESFAWNEHENLYYFIKDDVCLDGYLANRYPDLPQVVRALCYGSLYLIDIENCQPDAGPIVHEFNPAGIYSARTGDAIGQLLYDGLDESRIRHAIQSDVVPWCLGETDPLHSVAT